MRTHDGERKCHEVRQAVKVSKSIFMNHLSKLSKRRSNVAPNFEWPLVPSFFAD